MAATNRRERTWVSSFGSSSVVSLGWLASLIMRTDAQQGILLNIVVGIVGARDLAGLILGGGIINSGISAGPDHHPDGRCLARSILLAIVNLVRRGIASART